MPSLTKRALFLILATFLACGLSAAMPALAFGEEPQETTSTDILLLDEDAEPAPIVPLAGPPFFAIGLNTYNTLAEALAAAVDGDIITLLDDYTDNTGTSIIVSTASGISLLTIDLDGFDLDIATGDIQIGIGGELIIVGAGTVSVYETLEVDGGTLTAHADIISISFQDNYFFGLYAVNGAQVSVTGNVTSNGYFTPAVTAVGVGTSVDVLGDIQGFGLSSAGVSAQDGALVMATGNISGGAAGISAIEAANVTVTGNVSTTEPLFGYNAISAIDATVTVTGNVTAVVDANSVGAFAQNGGMITIDGIITASVYIMLDTATKTAADYQANSSLAGYLEFTDGTNFVWVKGEIPSQPGGTPATGDSTGMVALAIILALAALGMAGIELSRRHRLISLR